MAWDYAAHLEHLAWLHGLATHAVPPISPEVAAFSWRVFLAAWVESGFRLPIPAACSGPDGEMFYAWDRGRHHLEVEIIPGGPAEWFYRDRATDRFWGEDWTVGDPLPAAVVGVLGLFGEDA